MIIYFGCVSDKLNPNNYFVRAQQAQKTKWRIVSLIGISQRNTVQTNHYTLRCNACKIDHFEKQPL
jgi:hypothetical protein